MTAQPEPPPDTLQIENYVQSFAGWANRSLEVLWMEGASERLDPNDAEYTKPTDRDGSSKIVSMISADRGTQRYCLDVDARPVGSTADLYLEASLASLSGGPIEITSANELHLSLPYAGEGSDFDDAPITIQQYDAMSLWLTFPMYDVRKVIQHNGGVIGLADLDGSYSSEVPYAYFHLSFARDRWSDFNGDGRTDFNDFAILAGSMGEVDVSSQCDIAGPQGKGLPDRNIDMHDLLAFCQEWTQ